MAGYSNAKTTGLYDRRNDDASVGEVERMGICQSYEQEKLTRGKNSKTSSKNSPCLFVLRSALPVSIVDFSHLGKTKSTKPAEWW